MTADFCIERVNALDDATCYVLPRAPTSELLLYLHGIIPPTKRSPQNTNLQTVIANACARAGVAALIPRGRQGLGPKGRAGWWGWPTSGAAHSKLARGIVAELQGKRKALESLVGRPFTRLYVAGSSAGAYFLADLALSGGIEADGFAILSGGTDRAGAALDELRPTPVYVGYGTYDNVAPGARALAQHVRRAGWPVRVAAHAIGHGASEVYLDEAFEFWRASAPAPVQSELR